jgi:hypothetical protein
VPLEKLREIKVSPYRDSFPSYHGLIETRNHRTYTITVRIYDKPKIPISKLDQEALLNSLSHELAHLKNWDDYTIERFVLETQIYLRFGKKLKQIGYEFDRNRINTIKKVKT